MKHCSSGREKWFGGRQPGSGEWWWCLWAPGKTGALPGSTRHLPVLTKLLDSSPTPATTCFVILGKSRLLCAPQCARL